MPLTTEAGRTAERLNCPKVECDNPISLCPAKCLWLAVQELRVTFGRTADNMTTDGVNKRLDELLMIDRDGAQLWLEAARVCRDEYCRRVPGKRTWTELTPQEQQIDADCLRVAFDLIRARTRT